MNFTDIVNVAAERLDLTSAEAIARIGRHVNAHYKRVTSSLGLQPSRRTIVPGDATIGSQLLTFTGIEKVHRVEDRTSGQTVILKEVSNEEIAEHSTDRLTAYAIYSTTAGSVTIRMNIVPTAVFSLYAEGLNRAATLAGTDEPAFPESYHDILVSCAVYEERLKQEKLQLAQLAKLEYESREGDLRLFIAKSAQQDIFQGKRPGPLGSGTTASGGGSGIGIPVTVDKGGTGRTTLTNHGVLIGAGSSAINVTSAGVAGQVLVSGGPSADPTWGSSFSPAEVAARVALGI